MYKRVSDPKDALGQFMTFELSRSLRDELVERLAARERGAASGIDPSQRATHPPPETTPTRQQAQRSTGSATSSVDDLGPFRRKLQQQEDSVTAELVGGAFDPADVTIVQDALDIGAMDLDNYPENARWFAAHPEHASSAEDRWWGLMLAAAAKRGDDNARRFPLLRAEYFTRADQIFERARDLVFLYEADYRMWSVTPNPALAGVGARIAYAVRTYPDRHRFDNWFYSMEPEEGVRRMLRDEHPELLVALDEVARMPGTTTWWPLPRPRPSHDDDDDPWYETATEVGIAIIPFIGEAVMAYEAVLGYDLFGHELSAGARAIRVVGVALPTLGRLAGETRAAITWEGAAVREEDRFIAEAPSAPPGAAATTEQVTSPPPAAAAAVRGEAIYGAVPAIPGRDFYEPTAGRPLVYEPADPQSGVSPMFREDATQIGVEPRSRLVANISSGSDVAPGLSGVRWSEAFSQGQLEQLLDLPGSGFERIAHPTTGRRISEPGFRGGVSINMGRAQAQAAHRLSGATFPDVYGTRTAIGQEEAMELKTVPSGDTVASHFRRAEVSSQIISQHAAGWSTCPPEPSRTSWWTSGRAGRVSPRR